MSVRHSELQFQDCSGFRGLDLGNMNFTDFPETNADFEQSPYLNNGNKLFYRHSRIIPWFKVAQVILIEILFFYFKGFLLQFL